MDKYLIQILMAFLGTVGFSVFFTVKKSRVWILGIGGALIWAEFLVVNYCTDSGVIGLLTASATASVIAEIMARVLKSPTSVLLLPMLIPLIPGGNLYYTMLNMVQGNTNEFKFYLQLVLSQAASIAIGIILVASAVQIMYKAKRYRIKVLARKK